MTRMPCEVLSPSTDGIATAAGILRGGGLVAFATETVYGLGADATNEDACKAIYRAKGRPSFNPLIVHVSDLRMAEEYAVFTPLARKAAESFWPGPLTLVLDAVLGSGLCRSVAAGLSTVAIRCPAGGVATRLIAELGRPIAAPSANISGRVSATTETEVLAQLGGRIDAVVASGATPLGVESTIVDARDGLKILRFGALSAEEIGQVLACAPTFEANGPLRAPGQLASHYAPNATVLAHVTQPTPGVYWIGFGDCPGCDASLSPTGDIAEAARLLYQTMIQADLALNGSGVIGFAPIPDIGLGRAINDRIRRAAAPKSTTGFVSEDRNSSPDRQESS